jgi:DHA1 family tetracycline resistance protein-like MFS transporter
MRVIMVDDADRHDVDRHHHFRDAVLVGHFTASQAEQAFWSARSRSRSRSANFFASHGAGRASPTVFGRRPCCCSGSAAFRSASSSPDRDELWPLSRSARQRRVMANASIANAYVADITPPEERAQRFGMLGAMFGSVSSSGRRSAGSRRHQRAAAFFVAGSGGLLNFLYGVFVLPESLPPERRRPMKWRAALNRSQRSAHLRDLKASEAWSS